MRKKAIWKGLAALSIVAAVYLGAGANMASADATATPTEAADATAAPTEAPVSTNTLGATNITIDYTTQRINVNNVGANNQILFGICTVSGKVGDLKIKPITSWEVYPVEVIKDENSIETKKVVIDISTLNTQKENCFQIKGDVNTDPITVYIPATDKKIKMKFDPFNHVVYNNKGNTEDEVTKQPYHFEYRTAYGTWKDYGTYEKASQDNLEFYQQRGATLYFRQKSSGTSNSGTSNNEIKLTTSKLTYNDKDKTPVNDVYEAPSLPGKEIKVSIGKKANGPKVTVNYLKNTVTIPKDSQYRVGIGSGALSTFSPAVTVKTELGDVKVGEGEDATLLAELLKNGGSIEAKKAGDEAKKKAESKVSHFDFPKKQEVLKTDKEIGETTDVNAVKVGVDGNTADNNPKYDITVTAVKEDKDKNGNASYTLELTNSATKGDADFKYEVVVCKSTDANKDKEPVVGAKETKVTKAIAAGATNVKITKLGAGDVVWIHKAGNAKTQTWATEYVRLGKIIAASPSAAPSPSPTTNTGASASPATSPT